MGKDESYANFDSAKIAHLNMVQSIVNRLEGNAFTIKAIAMTLAAAVLALIGSLEAPNGIYPLAGILPVAVLWFIDAQYLRLGRLFRHLYGAIRRGEMKEPFSMDVRAYAKDEQSIIRIAFSWSVLWFYATILIVLAIVSVVVGAWR